MAEQSDNAQIQRRARRVLWSSGLCLALLFLMGLSGMASITLLHDDPMMRNNMRGFEGEVLRFVASIEGVVRFIHGWGGYVAIVLAGWAGLEAFSFARLLRRSDNADWRAASRRIAPLGLLGAGLMIVGLLLLIPTGAAAKIFFAEQVAEQSDIPAPSRPQAGAEYEKGPADWHVRELNFVLAIGVFLTLFAVSATRKVQLQAKKETKT